MDTRGDLFIIIRDTLRPLLQQVKFAEAAANELSEEWGNRIAEEISGLVQTAQSTSKTAVKVKLQALERELGWQVKQLIDQLVLRKKPIDTGETEIYQSVEEVILRTLAVMAVLLKWKTDPLALLRLFVTGRGWQFTSPPVVFQEKYNGPARLLFYSGLYALPNYVYLDRRKNLPDAALLALQELDLGGNPTDVLVHQSTANFACQRIVGLLDPASTLARLQWDIADVLGMMLGLDRVGVAWYPYASRHRGVATQRLAEMLLQNPGSFVDSFLRDQERVFSFFEMTVNEPGEELNLAGIAMRYITEGKDLHIPAVAFVERKAEKFGECIQNCRVVFNHPRISNTEAANSGIDAIRMVRGSAQEELSADDREFLDAVREAGLKPGGRAPYGFWPKFRDEWCIAHHQVNAQGLKVRYSRIRAKLDRECRLDNG